MAQGEMAQGEMAQGEPFERPKKPRKKKRYDDGAVFSGNFWVRPPDELKHRPATAADAAIIRGMCLRGDKQSEIAAYFDTNSGRINETWKGHRFPGVPPAHPSELPPPGGLRGHLAPGMMLHMLQRIEKKQNDFHEKQLQMQEQLRGFGLRIGLIEDPKAPRLGRRAPTA